MYFYSTKCPLSLFIIMPALQNVKFNLLEYTKMLNQPQQSGRGSVKLATVATNPLVSRKHTEHASSVEALAAAVGPRRHLCATTRPRRLAKVQMWPFFGGQLDPFLRC